MNQETYEALKTIVCYAHNSTDGEGVLANELAQVEGWVGELEKEFEDVKTLGEAERPPLLPTN